MFVSIILSIALFHFVKPDQPLAEEEFCQWLTKRCPFMSSSYRPVEDPDEAVAIEIEFDAKRMMKLDDVDQKFEVIGSFSFSWDGNMPCMENLMEVVKNDSTLSDNAKKTTECTFDMNKVWHPRIRHSNAVSDPKALYR